MTRRGWRWLFGAAASGVLVLSLLPVPAGLTVFSWQDKLEHALAFAALALLASLAQLGGRAARIGGLIGYGVLIELLQGLTPHRMADPWDALADAIGVLMGVGLGTWIERRQRPV